MIVLDKARETMLHGSLKKLAKNELRDYFDEAPIVWPINLKGVRCERDGENGVFGNNLRLRRCKPFPDQALRTKRMYERGLRCHTPRLFKDG